MPSGKSSSIPKKKPAVQSQIDEPPAGRSKSEINRAALCLKAMLRIQLVDQNDGSLRLLVAACLTVKYDLCEWSAVNTIREYGRKLSFPASWTEEDIQQRLRDAARRCTRGSAFQRDNDGCIKLGGLDPETGRIILSAKRTLPTAEAFVREFHDHPEGGTLKYYAGQLLTWRHNRYCEIEESAVRNKLQVWLHSALKYMFNRRTNEMQLTDFESNSATVKAALDSVRDFTHLSAAVNSPSWLGDEPAELPPNEILCCRSTLLHLPTMRHYPATPRFFSINSIDIDPDPNAPIPMAWLSFLHQLFDDDMESQDLLQEWFGYCLLGDTSQQKMLLMVGPKRSGKGTIARILSRLVGTGNVCGPTISALAGPFGMQPLIGKSMAIVSDARFHGAGITSVVERLLCISGEDMLSIDRKHMTSVTMKLPTRFLFLTNEIPRLIDASGALAGRFLILRLSESFYGKEDTGLTARLLAELPGILNWAIEGCKRLHERGRFVMPSRVAEVVQELEDLSSPIRAFVREECVIGLGQRVPVDVLYNAWNHWCLQDGRKTITTKQTFGRDLAAAFSGVERRRTTGMEPFYDGIGLKVMF
jgi:putative DNA primase/helicase